MYVYGQLIRAAVETLGADPSTVADKFTGRLWYNTVTDLLKFTNETNVVKVLLTSGDVVDADINASAAIAYSKLALTGSIVNADVNASAAIAYSKLALTGSIVNADINASAAIVYSKLSLTGSIVNADINASAAIAYSKLAALTANKVALTDASGFITFADTATYPSLTEFAYGKGVTSAIQTQLDAKQLRSTLTTKGDLYVATASNTVTRQGVGNNGEVLIADSTATNGMSWGNPSNINQIPPASASFEANSVGSWLGYADAAATNPVDGTGGSVSASLTFTATASSPLLGVYSGLISKTGGANLQGNGYSVSDLVVPLGWRGSNLDLSFLWSVVSGTYANGDLRIRVYDQTNGALITTVGTQEPALPTTTTGVAQRLAVVVPTQTSTALVRIIIHQSSTTTNNYTVSFDNLRLTLPFIAAPNYTWSASCGTYTNATASFTDVTNLTGTLTCSGSRRVFCELAFEASAGGKIKLTRSGGSADAQIQALRNSTNIGIFDINEGGGTSVSSCFAPFRWVDRPPQGTHTYKVQAKVVNASLSETIALSNLTLIVWEE